MEELLLGVGALWDAVEWWERGFMCFGGNMRARKGIEGGAAFHRITCDSGVLGLLLG